MPVNYRPFAQNANQEIFDLFEQLQQQCSNNEQQINVIKSFFLNEYAYLKDALDSSTIIVITDKYGTITYVNDRFCEISQFSKEEIIGNTHKIINSGFHSNDYYSDLWETILSGRIWSGAVRNKKKDGTYYWVFSNIIPIINNETKEIDNFISFRTDITDGKIAEQQLQKVIDNDLVRTIRNLDNMVFKLKKDRFGELFVTLVEGKLSKLLALTEGYFDKKRVEDFFGPELRDQVIDKCHAAFNGQKHSIKHHYNGLDLFTTLSPISENGRIIEIIGNTNDITLLELAQQEILTMAYFDDLTNLPNRRQLYLDLQEKLEKKSEQKFAALFVDIDRFKQINDTLGFQRGDRLLVKLGKRLKKFVSKNGKVYRLSGDDFVIIIEKYENDESLALVSQNILKLIEEPIVIDDHELLMTCSIGVTTFSQVEENTENILNRVETALKFCKLNGKQGYIFYDDEMDKNAKGRLNLEINLRKAIKNDELLLHFQPKFILKSKQIYGMEALVRWNSPKYGLVSPGEFIPLAEETGLIVQLGEWVLYKACKQNQEWIYKGYAPMRIAVNVSTIELLRPNFIDRVKRILKETGIDPQYVELEITENSFMQNIEKGIQILHELKSLGIYISIDDFGTGYSSLGYLKRFPINALKIDKSFIKEIDYNQSDAEIVKAMVQLGHTFRLKVIAEGVETNTVAKVLDDMDCDIVQGFYFGKPLPADMFEKLLES